MRKRLILLLCVGLAAGQTYAQRDPLYAQFLANPLPLNPAYSGLNNRLNAFAQQRVQWQGLATGKPTSNTFSAHTSLVKNKVGIGVVFVDDKTTTTDMTHVALTPSYKIALQRATVSFGMTVGSVRLSNNNNGLLFQHPNDPAFDTYNTTVFNFGAGVMVKTDKFLVGVAMPRIREWRTSAAASAVVYRPTFNVMGSYILQLNERISFRPAALLIAQGGQPFSYEAYANFQFQDFFSAGVFTRNLDALGGQVQVIFNSLRFGYAFEMPLANTNVPFPSHELMLGLSLSVFYFQHKSFSVY